ncbi:Cysteine proteinase inhibitor 5 [Acorus calamus]|uniref:Cysteine proteinase inhibitor 5 n=1 Tax=Acorus calamus TaxID=4465 RepID=A0AAV9C8I4_ACOCL|nr:Cysteine proteinase inhibitor 5 [Acorus calamus]
MQEITMRFQTPLLLLLLLLPLLLLTHASLNGEWKLIEDVNDPHVREIGLYAVTENNKRTGDHISLDRVLSGESQVVAGINYRLLISVNQDGASAVKYRAVVWEKEWEGFRNLTSFKLE